MTDTVPPFALPTIRCAGNSDMAAIRAIYAHYVLNGIATFEETPPSVDDMISRRNTVVAAELPYLVAENDLRIVGYCYASAYRPRSAYRFTVEDSVYVAHDMQRRGIGRALLGALIARCEAGCWRQMVAVIGNSGNAGSIALHERMGFAPVGTLVGVGFKFGRWVDSVLMQRALNEGTRSLPAEAERAGA
jgi:L-amino acid N-acyltransferase YncA